MNDFTTRVIHADDFDKIEEGHGFKFTQKEWYPYNLNNWHCGVDIISKGNVGKQFKDIRLICPFQRASIKTNDKLEYGYYCLLYELDDDLKQTGRGLYFGHIARFLHASDIVKLGEVFAIMGGTGTWVYPRGYIHCHIELKNQRGNAVMEYGDIKLWE
jgi:hypothetical protein